MSKYNKKILSHPEIYISTFTNNPDKPYVLFINGGPGFNSGVIEFLIEYNHLFNLLDYNIILYDQRNCGRSKVISKNVAHQDNVHDLHKIIQYLISIKINVQTLIGHSYGAKLLFDYYNEFNSTIPGIFISTASSILVPRLNNLILDLSYLKKTNLKYYNEILNDMDELDLDKMWTLSENLTPLFQQNIDRPYLYWANLDSYEMVKNAQNQTNHLPTNMEVFVSVRKDLYSNKEKFNVEIDNLSIPTLWINGFHDLIINNTKEMLSSNSKIITFYKSSHYPHIEENDRFTEITNEFIKNLYADTVK